MATTLARMTGPEWQRTNTDVQTKQPQASLRGTAIAWSPHPDASRKAPSQLWQRCPRRPRQPRGAEMASGLERDDLNWQMELPYSLDTSMDA